MGGLPGDPARQLPGEPPDDDDDAFGGLFAPRRTGSGNRNDTARLPSVAPPGGPASTGWAGGPGGGWGGGPGGEGGRTRQYGVRGDGPPGWGSGQGWGGGPGWGSRPGSGGGPGKDWMARPPAASRNRSKIIIALAGAVAVVAAGAGVLGFEMHQHHAQPAGGATPGGGGSPVPSSAAAGNSMVTTAPAAARNPDARSIAKLLNSYFTAINSHDFSGYQSLLNPQMRQKVTLARFAAGYRSTTDSAATLTSISTAPNGRTLAAVTFTSHQDPAQSPDHSPCTIWGITLFLDKSDGGFLIGPAQPGYHASHRACSP